MNLNDRLKAGFAGLMLAACSNLGRPSVTPEPPAVTGVSSSGLELGVELRVDNPNPFPLVANGIKGTLFVQDDEKLGAATAHLDQAIAAKGTGTVQSQLDIPWTSIGTLRELVGQAEVPFTFKGELGVSGGPMKLSVPFELRGHLTREQIVAVSGSLLAPLLNR